MTDKIGQEIRPGSWIVYGHALGKCAALKLGMVLRVDEKITVLGVEDVYSWEHRAHLTTPARRKSTLTFPDRMIVLAEHMIPEQLRLGMRQRLAELKIELQ